MTVDEILTTVSFALGSPQCVDHPLSSRLPATGQTTSYRADTSRGENVPVPDDGTLRAGTALRFEDNGDGTVTDLNLGLMWEKKDLAGGLHDSRSTFAWSSIVFPQPVVIWDWLQQINSEGGAGFAGHSDWRIPNYKELMSIINLEVYRPAVATEFNSNCLNPCTIRDCSCTQPLAYWSSSTVSNNTADAWVVSFGLGEGGFVPKASGGASFVRAVRGGA